MTAAFIAPADVPETASISSQGSSRSRSNTPQVKAPCAPPPWSAKLINSDDPLARAGTRFADLGETRDLFETARGSPLLAWRRDRSTGWACTIGKYLARRG